MGPDLLTTALTLLRTWKVALTGIGDAVIVTDAQGGFTFLDQAARISPRWELQEAVERLLVHLS
jgi:hypothetical protein